MVTLISLCSFRFGQIRADPPPTPPHCCVLSHTALPATDPTARPRTSCSSASSIPQIQTLQGSSFHEKTAPRVSCSSLQRKKPRGKVEVTPARHSPVSPSEPRVLPASPSAPCGTGCRTQLPATEHSPEPRLAGTSSLPLNQLSHPPRRAAAPLSATKPGGQILPELSGRKQSLRAVPQFPQPLESQTSQTTATRLSAVL